MTPSTPSTLTAWSLQKTNSLFSSSYSCEERAVGSKNTSMSFNTILFVFLSSVDESHELIIVCSSSWSLLWSNSNDVPTFCFTWSKCRYTHYFAECLVLCQWCCSFSAKRGMWKQRKLLVWNVYYFKKKNTTMPMKRSLGLFLLMFVSRQTGSAPCELKNTRIYS